MTFNINASTVRRFELPLDEEISVIAVLLIRKVNLEIFAARAGNGNVWERKFFHPCTDFTAVSRSAGKAFRVGFQPFDYRFRELKLKRASVLDEDNTDVGIGSVNATALL